MKSEIFSEKVDGMICPQCEDEIARKITHRRGILTCRASYRKSCVLAEYDPDIISADEIKAALSDIGYPVGSGKRILMAGCGWKPCENPTGTFARANARRNTCMRSRCEI